MSNIKIRKSGISHVLAIASIALLIGVVFYWFTRAHNSAVLLSILPAIPLNEHLSFFTQWLGWLPSFIHVFAFSLLTYWALGRRHILFSSVLWGLINILFELGQALPPRLIQLLPDVVNLQSYLTHGVFDIFDLLACVMGAWAAWAISHKHNLANMGHIRICSFIKDRSGLKNRLVKERCHE